MATFYTESDLNSLLCCQARMPWKVGRFCRPLYVLYVSIRDKENKLVIAAGLQRVTKEIKRTIGEIEEVRRVVKQNKTMIGCKNQIQQNKASELQEFLCVIIDCYIPGQKENKPKQRKGLGSSDSKWPRRQNPRLPKRDASRDWGRWRQSIEKFQCKIQGQDNSQQNSSVGIQR